LDVSVVIVSYKVPYLLLLCLESLQKALQPITSEIIVIDNASGDETQDLVQNHFPEVNYIQSETNDGFSIANNKGIELAKGEYIFLINPDTVISEQTIAVALQKHKALPNCGILGVQLVDGTGDFLPESKINQLTLRIAALKFLGVSKPFYNQEIEPDGEGETATLVGAFMCFRKADYKTVDGLDDRYFMYGEDIDLSYQFVKKGFKNYYLGTTSIIHFKGESTLKDKTYFNRFFTSVKYYFQKHYTNSKWIVGFLSLFFFIAKWTKKSDMVKKQRRALEVENIFCVTQNQDLIDQLKTYFNKGVQQIDKKTVLQSNFRKSYIIFDTDYISVEALIATMKLHAAKDNFFRIKPSAVNVLIGSDSSTAQGEVIRFNT